MVPTVNDDDVFNDDDDVSDWEGDHDALKKVDITAEPVQSNDTWENETMCRWRKWIKIGYMDILWVCYGYVMGMLWLISRQAVNNTHNNTHNKWGHL